MFSHRFAFVLLAPMAFGACAEAIDAWGPSTRIETNPAVARCVLVGSGLHRVVTTPVRVVLPKEATPVRLTCETEGYIASAHTLKTTINESVAGNMLLGSSIGLAIDIMSGAAEQYPSRVLIELEPESFGTIGERDAWYGRFQTATETKWNTLVENLRVTCEEELETPADCQEEHGQAVTDRETALKALERRRDHARVLPKAQALSILE